MKDVLLVVACTAIALALVMASVVIGHDRRTLVAAPEAVAEQFARKLATGRYDVARTQTDDGSRSMRERIRSASDRLRARAGAIDQVTGMAGWIGIDTATASVVLSTERAGEITMEFELVRRSGSWRIENWED
jgi:gamma-glutamyl phosphate reductase